MYHSLRDAVRGWRKSAAHGSRGHRLAGFAGGALLGLAALTPPVATAVGLRRRRRRTALLGLAGWAGIAGARLATDQLLPGPRRDAPLVPLGLAGLAAITVRSTLDRARGGAFWRGRRYPYAE
jgi:peptidoglycan/LPS O-acetylase OafA/YrhL